MKKDLLIGSRGSKLALTQAEWVKARLVLACPEVSVHIEVIKTSGDVRREPLSAIGGKGFFTKELEDALLDSRIDVAVHSLKDLPTILPEALTLSAICEREDARDALVLRQACVGSVGRIALRREYLTKKCFPPWDRARLGSKLETMTQPPSRL